MGRSHFETARKGGDTRGDGPGLQSSEGVARLWELAPERNEAWTPDLALKPRAPVPRAVTNLPPAVKGHWDLSAGEKKQS